MRHDPLADALRGTSLDDHSAWQLALELFIVGYEGTTLPDDYAHMLENGLSGTILFKRNLTTDSDGALDLEALTAQTEAIHDAAAQCGWIRAPAICSVDQEGGLVARLRKPFTAFPPMRTLGDRGDLELIHRVGVQLGRECLAAGFNVDYAPILDVDTNPLNPIIGNRAFSRDPHQVAQMAGALLEGLQSTGVLGCGKHFPGHGDTDTDSHLDLPVLHHDLERLKSIELLPFSRLSSHLDLVMTAHVLFPTLDQKWPATLSPQILEPLLRVQCKYRGVIVSDDLEMQGVAKLFSPSACVAAGLAAGCNVFLVCRRADVLRDALDAAVTILQAPSEDALRMRALQSISRVRALRGKLTRPRVNAANLRALLASAETVNLRARLGTGTLA